MDNTSLRRLGIIEILSSEDRWFKSEEIAAYLGCTDKTVRTDIHIINTLFPEGWVIETNKGKGIYMHKPQDSSIGDIYSIFKKSAYSIQAILLILIKKVETIGELSNELFIHYNTVKSVLQRISSILSHYDLTLNRSPLGIQGLERDKRMVCNIVFYELYGHTNTWPIESIPFSVIESIVIDITEKYDISLYSYAMKKYIFYIGILIARNGNQLELDLDEPTIHKIKESLFFSVVNDICNEVEKVCKLKFTAEDRISFAIFISHLPYYSSIEITEHDVYNLYTNRSTSSFEELYFLVEFFEEYTGLELHIDREFIYTLYLQYKVYALLKFMPNKLIRHHSIVEYVQENYPILFIKIKSAFKKWTEKYSYPEVNQLTIAKTVLNMQASINLETMEKNVIFLNSEGEGVRRYNISKLKKVFGNKINFIGYRKKEMNTRILTELGIDLIITDYHIEVEKFPVVLINCIISNRDINEISKYLT